MVNARLCETTRLAFFFFARQRHLDFFNCEIKTQLQSVLNAISRRLGSKMFTCHLAI